jgi:uncharacterized protein YidB (DUF937 family)
MGLLDILNTIQNAGASDPRARPAPTGPRTGQPTGQATGQGESQGMSPMAKALLALLAVYAMKNMRRADAPQTQPAGRPGGNVTAGQPGGLGGALGGGTLGGLLGGLLGGAAAGTAVNGGLGGLLKQLQESGQGDVAKSWVGTGPNRDIAQGDLARALGTDTLDTLSDQTGMDRDDLLSGLSQYLPRFVDQLTPDGRLPTEEEADRMV